MWLKTWFDDRAAIALELLFRARRRPRCANSVQQVAQFTGLPIVAAGDVLMHVRSRKPLQDVLTATRLKRRWPNAAVSCRRMPSSTCVRAAGWRRSTPSMAGQCVAFAGRCSFSLAELKYEYPDEIVPAGETPTSHLRKLTLRGRDDALPARPQRRMAAADRTRTGAGRAARLRALFPDRRRYRAVGEGAGHPVPGPRQRGQFAGLLLPGRHRSRPAARQAVVRALHQRRAQRAARYRHRFRARAARAR